MNVFVGAFFCYLDDENIMVLKTSFFMADNHWSHQVSQISRLAKYHKSLKSHETFHFTFVLLLFRDTIIEFKEHLYYSSKTTPRNGMRNCP